MGSNRRLEKWQNKELHELCPSPNDIGAIKSRRIRRAGHVAHMEEKRNTYKILMWRLEGKKRLEDLDVDGKIIFKQM